MEPRIPPPPHTQPDAHQVLPVSASSSKLTSLKHRFDGNDLIVEAEFDGPMKALTYRLKGDAWCSIDYVYTVAGPQEYFGVGFDYPEKKIIGIRFLGEGPAPVYQNRLAGGTLDVWDRRYNDTVDGDPDDLRPGQHFDYPLFKGFYAGVRWLQLNTSEGPITAVVKRSSDWPVYVQVFKPTVPLLSQVGQTAVPFPSASISFLNAIPAVGSKFAGPRASGPMGQPAIAKGLYTGHIALYFGQLPVY